MTTAIALDPLAELEQALERLDGVEPFITITEQMALVSYRQGAELHTEVWLHGDRGWRMHGTHSVAG